MTLFRLIAFGLAFAGVIVPGTSFAGDWRVREISGAVRIAAPARPVANGVVDQVLPIGTSVTTGGNGRAVISNGEQRIVVGPNSRTTLAPEAGGMTRILQDLGSALFQVDKQRQPHFRVETPLLAAVVKGTTFTVSVETLGDQVHVAEGLVEVRSNNGNAFGDVGAGATAFVSRGMPAAVDIQTPSASVSSDVATLALAPIDYQLASGGLVLNLTQTSVPATGSQAVQGAGVDQSTKPTTPPGAVINTLLENAALGSTPGNGGGPFVGGSPNPSQGIGNVADGSNPGNGNGNGNGNAGSGSDTGNGNGNSGSGNGNGGANPGNGNGNAGSGSDAGNGNGNSGSGNGNGGANPGNGNAGSGSDAGNGNGNPGSGNGNGH